MNLADLIPDMWVLVKLVVTALLTTGLAVWIFKTLGEKWLSAKFNERLESYKHAQQKELQQLKFDIDALMDRTTKFHQYEFDVLPKLWKKISVAYGAVGNLAAAFQQYPDLEHMDETEFNSFVEKCNLHNWEKKKLSDSSDRNKYYQDRIFFKDYSEASRQNNKFNNYFILNSIFLEDELRRDCEKLRITMGSILIDLNMERRFPHAPNPQPDKRQKYFEDGETSIKEISQKVRNRLWNARSLDD